MRAATVAALVLVVVPPAAAVAAGVGRLSAGMGPRPARVLLVGDSLTASAGPAVAGLLGAARRAPVVKVAAFGGTGLASGFDWPAEGARLGASFRPDVTVLEFVGNYFAPYATDATGRTIAPGSEAFFRLWEARARSLTSALRSAGSEVYWVVPPPMGDSLEPVASRLAGVYRTIASDTPGVDLVDERSSFSGPGSRYVARQWVGGVYRAVRTADGVHLTAAGDRLWATVLVRTLDRRDRFDVPESALPGPAPV